MKRIAIVLLLVVASAASAEDGQRFRLCDKASATQCASVNASGQLSISGSISASTTGRATAAAPSYVEGTDNPLSIDLSGNIRTLATATTAAKATAADPAYVEASTSPISQDLSGHLRIVAASLPLPTGAATSAKQDTGNASLASIDGKDFATQTTLALIKAKTDNLDVALSTRTKPADTQAISAAALPLPSGAAISAAQTDGTQKAISRGGAKGATAAADVTSTANGADHQGLDVAVQGTVPVSGTVTTAPPSNASTNVAQFGGTNVSTGTGAGGAGIPRVTISNDSNVLATQSGTWTVQPGNTANTTAWKVDGSAVTQPISGTTTANQGTAAALAGAWPVKPTDGTTAITVKAASTLPVATDTAEVVTLRDTATAQGSKTNNNAAPGATNFGDMPLLANAGVPSWTEGNLVFGSADLAGAARVVERPPVVTGAYRAHVTTGGYAGVAADGTLISFRYTGTGLCVVTRVRAFVTTQTAATVAGRIDRGLYIVRSFTVADSGGTAVTLTSPFGKLRTSYAATGLGNLMVLSAGALTKGTGTQDANPVGVFAKQGTATEPIGLTLPAPGEDEDLFVYNVGQNLPIQLVQNEGLRISILTAMPTTLAQVTAATFEWYEVAAANF